MKSLTHSTVACKSVNACSFHNMARYGSLQWKGSTGLGFCCTVQPFKETCICKYILAGSFNICHPTELVLLVHYWFLNVLMVYISTNETWTSIFLATKYSALYLTCKNTQCIQLLIWSHGVELSRNISTFWFSCQRNTSLIYNFLFSFEPLA